MRKPKKGKAVNYRLIPRDSEAGRPMYEMLDRLVAEHHDQLYAARFALAWNTSWKPDVDGRVTLGKCKKATDLDRELAAFDFIILLRREFWESSFVDDKKREALLDHELCHAAVKFDKDGEPEVDERGRTVFRIRKHDIEEFAEIAARHGCWKRDLETFASALRRGQQRPLPLDDDAAAAGPTSTETRH